MSAHLYVEGGESKEDQIRCREGFRKLLEKAGFSGRMPRLSACGGRGSVFDDFKTAYALRKVGDYIATREELEGRCADLFRWIAGGVVEVRVGGRFPLRDAAG